MKANLGSGRTGHRDTATLRNWIDACAQCMYLNQWEEGFIASVDQQLDNYGHLSVAQEEHLERIYAERTR